MKIKNRLLILALSTMMAQATDYHVSTTGDDTASGTAEAPFKTISKAAELAQPGDTITVAAGTYRERIDPPRGGTSPDAHITYQAAEGEEVILKGSEIVTDWVPAEGNVWKLEVPNSFFGDFNPYADLIQGDWYEARQPYHSGAVFLDGHWLREAASKDAVFGKEETASADKELLSFSSVTFTGLSPLTTAEISEKSRDFPVVTSERGSSGVGPMKAGDWLLYKGVDFGAEGVTGVSTSTGSPVGGGNVEIRLGSHEGELLGTVDAMLTAEWTFFASYSAKLAKPLTGKQDIALVFKPRPLPISYTESIGNWYGEVGDTVTTIWADFKGKNPTEHLTEINARQAIFYPSQNNIDYLTVRGFTMEQAATPWSPPTAEQIGLIGTNWSKGWLIENNTIRYSTCTGLTLGKHGDEYDNTYDYFRSIRIGIEERGWNKETIGSHVVRNNHIHDCGQAGIVGSLGSAFCTIEGNEIHDIRKDHQFGGCETAGVKLHGAVDTIVKGNHIYNCEHWGGLWLDWMCQGARVTGNLLHHNSNDMMFEMNHGPMLVDNNILLSEGPCLLDASGGHAYVNNIFAGHVRIWDYLTNRRTPYFKPHSTEVILPETESGSDYGADSGSPVTFEAPVQNTDDATIYQSLRYGMTKYLLDVPTGTYMVTLQFNEPVHEVAGARVFNVALQEASVVEKLDVFAEVGKNTAYDMVIDQCEVTDGQLKVEFSKVIGEPILSGIKVEGRTRSGGHFTYALNAGGGATGNYLADLTITPSSDTAPKLPANFGVTVDQSDDRFINNLFLGGEALSQYDPHDFKITAAGNVYGGNSQPTKQEQNPTLDSASTKPLLEEKDGEWWITLQVAPSWLEQTRPVITSADLGKAVLPDMTFQHTDGTPYTINQDYLGTTRPTDNTSPGAFQISSAGEVNLKVWKKN